MGLTYLELEISNQANPEVTERLEFLIDSGAIYAAVPIPVLERLGVKPYKEETFRLANGEEIVRKVGMVLLPRSIEEP